MCCVIYSIHLLNWKCIVLFELLEVSKWILGSLTSLFYKPCVRSDVLTEWVNICLHSYKGTRDDRMKPRGILRGYSVHPACHLEGITLPDWGYSDEVKGKHIREKEKKEEIARTWEIVYVTDLWPALNRKGFACSFRFMYFCAYVLVSNCVCLGACRRQFSL